MTEPNDTLVETLRAHRDHDGNLVEPPTQYMTTAKKAVYLASVKFARVVASDEVASPVRVVETKEGAVSEVAAPSVAVAKEAAPKARGKGKARR